MTVNCILGVDPGIHGGVAFYWPADPSRITAEDIPIVANEVDIDTLAARIRQMKPDVAFIERVAAMPKQGVSSTFRFGMAYGSIRGIMTTLNIPVHLVTPGKWKGHFRLSSDGELSRALAIQFWPGAGCFTRVRDHNRAEAALIARYGAGKLDEVASPLSEGDAA